MWKWVVGLLLVVAIAANAKDVARYMKMVEMSK